MKLLLTADLHIAKEEDVALLVRIFAAAKEEDCKAILIGGDLLDSPFPDSATERALLAALEGCTLPILMVAGNHDALGLTDCYKKMPKQVHLFSSELSAYSLDEQITVYGQSAFKNQGEAGIGGPLSLSKEGVAILLVHGSPDAGQDSFSPISTAALSESGFALAVIGHIHKSEQRMVGGCRILIPGIPEGRGWDETGERFIWIAEVGSGITLSSKKVAVKTYQEIEVDITDCEEEDILRKLEAVERPADTVIRLILKGTPAADPQGAARLFSEKYGIQIKDQSDPTQSVALLMQQNTLQGAFVRRAMEEIAHASEEERAQLEEALRMGLRALKEGLL